VGVMDSDYVNNVVLKVVVDNNSGARGLRVRWGLSIFVQTDRSTFLFDTGPDPVTLEHNLRHLGIDPQEIEFVFISHGHGDHMGGLNFFARIKKNLPIFIPNVPSLERCVRSMGLNPIPITYPKTIAPGIFSTGTLNGMIREQGLIIHIRDRGGILLVGCSHPGLIRMIKVAHNVLKRDIFMVMGGFHLGGTRKGELDAIVETFNQFNVSMVVPIHCSGEMAREYFKRVLGNRCYCGGIGLEVTISSDQIKIK